MSVRLHVNVDHIATLRNARGSPYPDPVRGAEECIAAGADGITAHLREDRRHIRDADIDRLSALCAKVDTTFNFEMAATEEMVAFGLRVKPDACTLVPERREERTTEGGLDVQAGGEALARRIAALVAGGIKVSLFIAADPDSIDRARALGARQVELHTGEYAHERAGELARLAAGAKRAHAAGLEVAAGHGLTQANVPALVEIPEIVELNIGHAIISDAVFVGLAPAVRGISTPSLWALHGAEAWPSLHLTRPEAGARFSIWGGLRDSETACGAGVSGRTQGRLLGHRPPQIKKRTPVPGALFTKFREVRDVVRVVSDVVRVLSDVERDVSGVERDGSDVERDESGVARDGSGVARVGSGVARVGSGVARVGSGVARDGSGVARVGSGVARVGSDVARVGS